MKKVTVTTTITGAKFIFREGNPNDSRTVAQYLAEYGFDKEPYTTVIEDCTAEVALEQCYAARREAYGPLPDQLDEIYHDFDAWKARIAQVKTQHPKP
jgi:hypothetical protein